MERIRIHPSQLARVESLLDALFIEYDWTGLNNEVLLVDEADMDAISQLFDREDIEWELL